MTEAIATVSIARDEEGRYAVVIVFADGKLREVSSADWRTLSAAMDFAARLIGGELSRRLALSEVP